MSLQLIQAGKGEALRIRAILRSLVPIEDLVGVISLPVQIPSFGKGKHLEKHNEFLRLGGINEVFCFFLYDHHMSYIVYSCVLKASPAHHFTSHHLSITLLIVNDFPKMFSSCCA